jgi:short subunit dehydrogenase-like uncharacterized protein
MTSRDRDKIVVYGASGTTGALIGRELAARGAMIAVAGRDRARLDGVAIELGIADVRVAAADDPAALAAAFDGAAVVVGCAGPFGRIGEPIAAAAIAAGCHYLDISGEQAFMRDVYERLGSAARAAGVVAVSGMAFEIAVGDWAAACAATRLAGTPADGARVADGDPLDELTVCYAFDDAASQRSYADMIAQPGWVWRGDRWDETPLAGEPRTVNFGPELGGERPAMSFPSGEVITVPRHVDVRRVQTYVSLTRSRWLGAVTRAAARAAPLIYRGPAGRLLEESMTRVVSSRDEHARTRFGVVARARRRFVVAQVRVIGSDPYGLSATLCADAAVDLAMRGSDVVGACTPSEVWPAEASLRRLADAGRIAVDAS